MGTLYAHFPGWRQIPYADRHIITPSGFALIWPFSNVEKESGPYELFLDNNALSRVTWLDELPIEFAGKLVINPWLALVEQWLSNTAFRREPEKQICDFVRRFQNRGIVFPVDYAETQAKRLRDNDEQNKTYWSLPFMYITILKKLMDGKQGQDDWLKKLEELGRAKVPRFSACLMLGVLLLFLKKKPSLKMAGEKMPAMSYLDSFFAYRPGKKSEPTYVSEGYLRNRAGDLGVWYLLPLLMQHRFAADGEPVVVTQDKVLHRVLFKVLPPAVHPTGTVAFAVDYEGFEQEASSELTGLISRVCATPFSPASSDAEKQCRMHNLYEFAKSCCTQEEESIELESVWNEWFLPGFGKEMVTS